MNANGDTFLQLLTLHFARMSCLITNQTPCSAITASAFLFSSPSFVRRTGLSSWNEAVRGLCELDARLQHRIMQLAGLDQHLQAAGCCATQRIENKCFIIFTVQNIGSQSHTAMPHNCLQAEAHTSRAGHGGLPRTLVRTAEDAGYASKLYI